jgi:hypothetical protein
MIKFTIWDLVTIVGYEALLYAGGPLVMVAVLLLAIPALRRTTIARRSGYGLLALVVLLGLCATPLLYEDWMEHERRVAFDAATHHLTAPQIIDDISFPAGSTVHVGDDGHVQFGSLPAPTMVNGLPLIGDFTLEADRGDGLSGGANGTLARATDLHGIPCGSGDFISRADTARCTLARDYVFTGHALASGQPLEVYRSPLNEPAKLVFGTLARAELLFDVIWPAGTIMGGIALPPERLAHGPDPEDGTAQFCLPSGLSVSIEGATLHGFLAYDVLMGRRLVSPVCSILPAERVGDDGYAQVGSERYGWGDRPSADAPWQWTEPLEPDER